MMQQRGWQDTYILADNSLFDRITDVVDDARRNAVTPIYDDDADALFLTYSATMSRLLQAQGEIGSLINKVNTVYKVRTEL